MYVFPYLFFLSMLVMFILAIIVQQVQTPQQQKPSQKEDSNSRRRVEYTFMDRMNMKRTEVIKLALFSLVIVLGISIDRMITHYISKYIGDNVLTDFQELLLRISYPIAIFLLLWIFMMISYIYDFNTQLYIYGFITLSMLNIVYMCSNEFDRKHKLYHSSDFIGLKESIHKIEKSNMYIQELVDNI